VIVETLGNLESFARAAEAKRFSEAARGMGISAAVVSKNVARLEAHLGMRLFHCSTRSLTLTEAAELLYQQVAPGLETIQGTINQVGETRQVPAGRLLVGLSPSFAYDYVLPLLKTFMQRYPAVVPDWQLETRRVDLIGEGFDVAIGGGMKLSPAVVARELAKLYLVVVAAPSWVEGIVMRSIHSGRLLNWTLCDLGGGRFDLNLKPKAIMNASEALYSCAVMGLGRAASFG
jgi:DNA-binding transcriptional LysR family regulator